MGDLSSAPLTMSLANAKSGEGYFNSSSNFFLVEGVTSIQDLCSCWELLYCTRRPLEDNQTVSKEKKKPTETWKSGQIGGDSIKLCFTSLQKAVFHSWEKAKVLSYEGTPLQHSPSKLNSQLRVRHSPSPSNELKASTRASPETAPELEIQKGGCKILVCEMWGSTQAVWLNKCINASLFMIIKIWKAKCVLDAIYSIDFKALYIKSTYTLQKTVPHFCTCNPGW